MTKRNRRGSRPRRRPRDTRLATQDYEYRAMRDLAVSRSARRRRALMVIGVVTIILFVLGLFLTVTPGAQAAEPGVIDPAASAAAGDVRSSSAPGMAGDLLFAVGGVAVVGAASVGLTLLYLRLTARTARR